jgi:hypothetical protein
MTILGTLHINQLRGYSSGVNTHKTNKNPQQTTTKNQQQLANSMPNGRFQLQNVATGKQSGRVQLINVASSMENGRFQLRNIANDLQKWKVPGPKCCK